MATMVDVARLAGVSISTVSHVLNRTRHVEAETKQRVLEAIAETGYRQDALARAMRRSQTESVGIVVSDAAEPAFAEMTRGVEQEARRHGLTLLLANSAEDSTRELTAVQTLLDRRVDGLVLARAAHSHSDLIPLLEGEKSPTVLLDRVFPDLAFDQVSADNRDTMRRLVAKLIDGGHRRMIMVAGFTVVPTLRERADGFLDAIGRIGSEGAALVLEGSDEEELSARLRSAIDEHRPTAIVAASTPLAVRALQTLAGLGMVVPRDVAFATFDGFPHSDLFAPQITTVRQPAFDMGVTAVQLLVDRMANRDAAPRTVRLQQTIEERESTQGHHVADK